MVELQVTQDENDTPAAPPSTTDDDDDDDASDPPVKQIDVLRGSEVLQQNCGHYGTIVFVVRRPG